MHIRLKTKLETKKRRAAMRCCVLEVKIDKSHLSKKVLNHLDKLFLEAKWFYNHCVANASDLSTINATKTRSVPVLTPDGPEERTFTVLSSQMRQGIHERTWTNLKSLKALKDAGFQIGPLGYKPVINCIPLKQFGLTYKFNKENNRIRLQGLQTWLRTCGLEQIPDKAEIANAHLTRKCGDYFLKVTTYSEREVKTTEGAVGIDFGCGTQMALSNGVGIKFGVEVPKTVRRLDHTVARKRRGKGKKYWSGKYGKALVSREKAYAHVVNQRRDIRNKVISILTKAFGTICVQDESIKAWQASGHGKSISKSGIGGITAALQHKAATPVLVDKFFPSTKTCSSCGIKKKMKIGDRTYICPACGHTQDRDWNSAINILQEGLKLPAERRTIPPEEEASSLMELLNRIPGVTAKLLPAKGEAAVL